MNLKNIWIGISLGLLVTGIFIVINPIKYYLNKDKGVIIGICCGEAPYEYLDKKGNVQGINKELIEKSFKNNNLNKPFSWMVMPFNQSFIALNQGKIDFLATYLHINEEKRRLYDFAIICKSKIVTVYRINKDSKHVTYGLQGGSIFQKFAEIHKMNYINYDKLENIIFHFDCKKIDGIICDLRTLKQLLEKNLNEISSYRNIKIDIKNDIIIFENPSLNNNIEGSLNSILISSKEGRIYHNLKDLFMDFRCKEISKIIIKKSDLIENFNNYHGLKVQSNSKNFLLKSSLSLKFIKNTWIIEKNNNSQYNVVGTINKKNINGFNNIKEYIDADILMNDLMEDKINAIVLNNINEIPLNIFCSLANVDENYTSTFDSGFAFRKNNINEFDEKDKLIVKSTIEKVAIGMTSLNEYSTIDDKKNKQQD